MEQICHDTTRGRSTNATERDRRDYGPHVVLELPGVTHAAKWSEVIQMHTTGPESNRAVPYDLARTAPNRRSRRIFASIIRPIHLFHHHRIRSMPSPPLPSILGQPRLVWTCNWGEGRRESHPGTSIARSPSTRLVAFQTANTRL